MLGLALVSCSDVRAEGFEVYKAFTLRVQSSHEKVLGFEIVVV